MVVPSSTEDKQFNPLLRIIDIISRQTHRFLHKRSPLYRIFNISITFQLTLLEFWCSQEYSGISPRNWHLLDRGGIKGGKTSVENLILDSENLTKCVHVRDESVLRYFYDFEVDFSVVYYTSLWMLLLLLSLDRSLSMLWFCILHWFYHIEYCE